MSLVAYAVRTCLWRALFGTTSAGTRVHDSAITPLDDMVVADPQPFVVVSTEDDEAELDGWRLGHFERRRLDIVIEIVAGVAVRIEDQGGSPALAFAVAYTDDGLEASLNMIGRQVFAVAQLDNPWAVLLREFAHRPMHLQSRRGADAEKTRFAARQYVIRTEVVDEPEFGAAPVGLWADFVAAMRADDILAGQADMIESVIRGEAIPSWRALQANLGLSQAGFEAIGLGPDSAADPADEAPALTEIVVDEVGCETWSVQP